MAELSARVRAILRRAKGSHGAPVFEVGNVSFDTRTKNATRDGEAVELTAQEANVLSYLFHNAGRYVSNAELGDHVYEHDHDPGLEHDRGVHPAAPQEARLGSYRDIARTGLQDFPPVMRSLKRRAMAGAVVWTFVVFVIGVTAFLALFDRITISRFDEVLEERLIQATVALSYSAPSEEAMSQLHGGSGLQPTLLRPVLAGREHRQGELLVSKIAVRREACPAGPCLRPRAGVLARPRSRRARCAACRRRSCSMIQALGSSQ
jgi:hypothetical protein